MWCWQFVIGIWMCVVCCCPLRNCFFNWCAKHRCIFVQCKSVSLKMCSRHVVCIIQIHMPCRLLVLHAPLYTNIVDRKSGPFGGNLDKNAKNWLEQGALAIFWRFLTPGNKWCLDWSWFQTIYPIPIFDILFPFPVTKSQSQWLKSHFPFRTLIILNKIFEYFFLGWGDDNPLLSQKFLKSLIFALKSLIFALESQ